MLHIYIYIFELDTSINLSDVKINAVINLAKIKRKAMIKPNQLTNLLLNYVVRGIGI